MRIGWLALLAASPAPGETITVLNGPATVVADSGSGELLTIGTRGGVGRVAVRTSPSLTLICDSAPSPTCLAWVPRGQTVTVTVSRAGGGAPAPEHWRGDCTGTRGANCIVRMDRSRTVAVDWR